MHYEILIPIGYVLAVAIKVLIPQNSNSKLCRLALAESELFSKLCHLPELDCLQDSKLKASQFMIMDNFHNRTAENPCNNNTTKQLIQKEELVPLEVYG